jgi:hypothetical protein
VATLLEEIQRDAADDRVSVTSLLRKCQILAGRLRAPDFSAWVARELGGYAESDPLPPYRTRLRGQVVGDAANLVYRHTNATLGETMIPEEFRDDFIYMEVRQPIAELQDLVASGRPPARPLPPELYPQMSRHLSGGYQVTSARVEYSRSALVAVLDAIRTRALEFAIQIEALNPAAGESSPSGEPPISPSDVQGAVTNTIYAQNVNVAQASAGVNQSISVAVSVGDWDSLERALRDAGVTGQELESLKSAMAEDSSTRAPESVGRQVAQWLGEVTMRLMRTAGTVAAGAASQVIGMAIAAYYGIGGVR